MDSYDDFLLWLETGNTYLFHWNINTEHPHYQVILNNEIWNDPICIFLSVSSSKINKREEFIKSRWLDIKTLVMVESEEVNFFSKQSCFNCNDIQQYSPHDLYWIYLQWNLKYQWKIPHKILIKIQEWVKISEMISNRDKKIIWII